MRMSCCEPATAAAALAEAVHGETSSLPGFKLRRVTDWMAEHLAEDFSLARLADEAGECGA